MPRILKCSIFIFITSFLSEISSAQQYPLLYIVKQWDTPTIVACDITSIRGTLDECITVFRASKIKPTAVVISTGIESKGYVSSETGGVSGTGAVMVCDKMEYGKLKNCKNINYDFNRPYGMALDAGGRLYVTESGEQLVSVCANPNMPEHGGDCTPASTRLDGGPNSIVLNPNGDYAYISELNANTLAICQIDKSDPYRRFHGCRTYTGGFFDKIMSVAVDLTGKHLFFLTNVLGEREPNAYNCKLTDSGNGLTGCYSSIIDINDRFRNESTHTALALYPYQLYLDSALGFVSDQSEIYSCSISSTNFAYKCKKQKFKEPLGIQSIRYIFIDPNNAEKPHHSGHHTSVADSGSSSS